MRIDFHEKMNRKLEENINKALEEMCVECHSMEEFASEVDKAFAKMTAEIGKKYRRKYGSFRKEKQCSRRI